MTTEKKAKPVIPESYIAFDLETTGFTPDRGEIIEIGALRMVNGHVDGAYHSYVKPRGFLPLHITALTGITSELLDDAPRVDAVILRFLEFLNQKKLPLVAHNAPFDCRFMTANCQRLGQDFSKYEIFDSLKAAKAYVPLKCHKLEVIKDYFGLDFASHNAVDDCRVTAYLMEWCKLQNTTQNSPRG